MRMCEKNFIHFDYVDCMILVFKVKIKNLFLPSITKILDFESPA